MPSNTYNTSNNANPNNVVNLFTQQTIEIEPSARIIRVYAELNSLRMLYSSDDNLDRFVAVPILCWALTESGEVLGMVPWLNEVTDCQTVEDNFDVNWEGFYNPLTEEIFFQPPDESVALLTTSARFIDKTHFGTNNTDMPPVTIGSDAINSCDTIIQEFSDPIGTHALLLNANNESLLLTSVISWTLNNKGRLQAMLADDSKIEKLPVLPGDSCLYDAYTNETFKCFFQRDIAEQIREQNPETLQAIEKLFANE